MNLNQDNQLPPRRNDNPGGSQEPVRANEDRSSGSFRDDYQTEYADYIQDIAKPRSEDMVLEWKAPSRPFKKRNRQYHTTVITIALLLSLILFFAGQILTIAVVFAVAFLVYVMSTIPPHAVKNKLTTYGIRIEDNLYYWEELGRFWFDEKL